MNIPKSVTLLGDIDDRYIIEAAKEEPQMKRKFGIIKTVGIIAACIAIMAAGWTLFDSADYLREYDADPNYMLKDKMVASDGGEHYFGVVRTSHGFRLIGSDGEKTYSICDAENCDHTDPMICKAYTWPEITGVSVYDGRVYWTARKIDDYDTVEIRSASLDGTDVTVERTIPLEVNDGTMKSRYIRVHRGKMYLIGYGNGQTGDDSLKVWALDLSGDGKDEKIFTDSSFGPYSAYFYANNLYIVMTEYESGEQVRTTVTKIDLKSGKDKVIFKTDKEIPEKYLLDENENMYYVKTDPKTEKPVLVKLDTGSGIEEHLCELRDDPGFCFGIVNGKAVFINDRTLYVYGTDGTETVLDISGVCAEVMEKYGDLSISFVGVDEKNVVLSLYYEDCYTLVHLDGSEPRVVLSEKE